MHHDINKLPGQAVKLDQAKNRLDLIPVSLVTQVGEILTFGAVKYADRDWEKGMAWSRPYGAALRHIFAWWSSENLDPETSKSHLAHAITELAFLLEYEHTHPELDDRPGKTTPATVASPALQRLVDDALLNQPLKAGSILPATPTGVAFGETTVQAPPATPTTNAAGPSSPSVPERVKKAVGGMFAKTGNNAAETKAD